VKIKKWILVATALAPFGLSLIPPLYVVLVYYYSFTYLVSGLYGLWWSVLFCTMYIHAEAGDRRKLRWLALLAIFAFVEPAHLILMALGVPLFLPSSFTPS
jgi:hypothetical protein